MAHPNQPPSPRTATPQVKTKELQALLMQIRRDEPSLNWQQVADRVGVSRQYAMKLSKKAMRDIIQEPTEDVIKIELARLDDLYTKVMGILNSFHVVVSHGQIMRDVIDGPDGQPLVDMVTGKLITKRLEDTAPKLAAVDRAIRIAERRAKLLGLDKIIAGDKDKAGMTAEEFAVAILGATNKMDAASGGADGKDPSAEQ